MLNKFLTFTLFCCLTAVFGGVVRGQTEVGPQSQKTTSQKEDLPDNIKETLAKQRIEREKKEYDELLARCREAVKISDELERSFANSQQMTPETAKKLDRLEKLVKKIRGDLGGDDDDSTAEKNETTPETENGLVAAFKKLQTGAAQLLDDITKSTRYSISVFSIQTSNALLKLVRFIRFFK
ncbi:MAG: hypothetical protein JSS81_25840 [Acidobacteria bacterium]|nr:hypothetical protein [Acidobacteriota bacterium]